MLKNSANRRVGTWSLSPQRPSMNTFTRKRKEGTSLGSGLEDQTKRRRVSGSGQTEVSGRSTTGILGNQAIKRANIVCHRLFIPWNGMTTIAMPNWMLSAARHCCQVRFTLGVTTFPPPSGSQQHECSNDNKCSQSCKQDWEEHGDRCFYWSQETKSWNDAEESCKEKGGHLASVTSTATNDYIEAGMSDYLWIGGSFFGSEGVWKWSDCSDWDFTNWGTLEPSNKTMRDCLGYNKTSRMWSDSRCNIKKRFLCSTKSCSGEIHLFFH